LRYNAPHVTVFIEGFIVSTSPHERIDYAETLPHRTKIIILVGVMLGLFLSALDQTIVSTAMPAIIKDLQGLDYVAWTSTAYLLASTTMVPIYGKLSDLFGRRIVLLTGIAVFLLGSILCGISQDIFQLIGFRVLQGLGAAALTSTAFAIPADLFSPAERPRYMGLFGAVFGLSSIIGPFLGGFLTDSLSWRWVFYVNMPIGILAFFFILRTMPTLASGIKAAIDWAGAGTLVLSVVPLLLALTLDKEIHAWDSPLIIGLFAMAVVFGALFLYAETKAASPIIKLSLFKDQIFSVTMFTSFLNGAAFFGAFLFLSLFLVNVSGVSATEAGTAQIPLMLSFVVGSIVASQLVARTGRYKPFILFGFGTMLIGFYFMTQLNVDSKSRDVVWRMLILGLGLGPTIPLLNLAMQNAVPFAYLGTAVANRQFFQQLGQATGAAIFGVILTTTLTAQIKVEMKPIFDTMPIAYQQQFDSATLRNSLSADVTGNQSIEGAMINGVNTQFDALTTQITAAVRDGDPAAKAAIAANPMVPDELKQGIASGALTAAALPKVLDGFTAARETAVKEARSTATDIGLAIKRAFARSITQIYNDAIWLVALSFLLIIFLLPEVPLRKTNRDIEPVLEGE
jgi:EmrB/QacA subfamily drug resistance transporter